LRAIPDSELIIGLLRLVDLSLVGNLILIVICASYDGREAAVATRPRTVSYGSR